MGRHPTSTSYITPLIAGGTPVQAPSNVEFGRGSFTLVAGTTYYYPLGGQDAPWLSAHLKWDAAIALVATIEDCNFPPSDVLDYSDNAGDWIDEDPTTAFVGTDGAGVVVANGVATVTAGSVGGAMWHVGDTGARRTRLKVAVGATGGEAVVAAWAKE